MKKTSPNKTTIWLLAAFSVASLVAASSAPVKAQEATTTATATAVTTSQEATTTPQLNPDAFKSIVKIKTYILNSQNELTLAGSGSGVIISSSGLILTNNHVISVEDSFDGKYQEAGYVVCLPKTVSDEPECNYTAKLVRWNKDLDTGLLQLVAVPKLSEMISFPYLELNSTDATQLNDTIFALGYPSIGGDTVTVTKGVVSGKSDKYGKSWIKTDAVVSFGNSGGAALDVKGKLIGIPTQAHSDFAGSIGYILNVTSVNDWIAQYRYGTVYGNRLNGRLGELARKQKILLSSNKFINYKPTYSITKPADWNFIFEDEASLVITKKSDEDGGGISIETVNYPYVVGPGDLDIAFRSLMFNRGMFSAKIDKATAVKFNGKPAKHYVISSDGETQDAYFIPAGNHFLYVTFDYGKDEKDQAIVDSVIKSITLGDQGGFSEVRRYSQKDPKFKLDAGNDWAFYVANDKGNPLQIANKKIKEMSVTISVDKTTSKTKNLSSEEYLKMEKQQVDTINKMTSFMDISASVIEAKAKTKLNNELKDVIKLKVSLTKASTKKIMLYETSYYKKVGDKIIKISFSYLGDNKQAAKKAELEFEKMIKTFSLK